MRIFRGQRRIPLVFPIHTADIIARGIGKGPRLGAAMRGGRAWVETGFPEAQKKLGTGEAPRSQYLKSFGAAA